MLELQRKINAPEKVDDESSIAVAISWVTEVGDTVRKKLRSRNEVELSLTGE